MPKTQSFDFGDARSMIDFKNKLVPLIETSRAIETVTQIAAFKDVVGLFFGAADASASLAAS